MESRNLQASAPALWHSHQAKGPVCRQNTASTSAAIDASTACSTSRRSPSNETRTQPASTSNEKSAKARRDAKPDEPINDTSPTASSAACGKTNKPESGSNQSPLDKGAFYSPQREHAAALSPYTTKRVLRFGDYVLDLTPPTEQITNHVQLRTDNDHPPRNPSEI